MLIISASRVHIEYLVLEPFNNLIKSPLARLSAPLKTLLERLCSLFALSRIVHPGSIDAIYFIESNSWGEAYLNTSQLNVIRFLVKKLLEQLLGEDTALRNAWEFSDASLCSALGMHDENV